MNSETSPSHSPSYAFVSITVIAKRIYSFISLYYLPYIHKKLSIIYKKNKYEKKYKIIEKKEIYVHLKVRDTLPEQKILPQDVGDPAFQSEETIAHLPPFLNLSTGILHQKLCDSEVRH